MGLTKVSTIFNVQLMKRIIDMDYDDDGDFYDSGCEEALCSLAIRNALRVAGIKKNVVIKRCDEGMFESSGSYNFNVDFDIMSDVEGKKEDVIERIHDVLAAQVNPHYVVCLYKER